MVPCRLLTLWLCYCLLITPYVRNDEPSQWIDYTLYNTSVWFEFATHPFVFKLANPTLLNSPSTRQIIPPWSSSWIVHQRYIFISASAQWLYSNMVPGITARLLMSHSTWDIEKSNRRKYIVNIIFQNLHGDNHRFEHSPSFCSFKVRSHIHFGWLEEQRKFLSNRLKISSHIHFHCNPNTLNFTYISFSKSASYVPFHQTSLSVSSLITTAYSLHHGIPINTKHSNPTPKGFDPQRVFRREILWFDD